MSNEDKGLALFMFLLLFGTITYGIRSYVIYDRQREIACMKVGGKIHYVNGEHACVRYEFLQAEIQ